MTREEAARIIDGAEALILNRDVKAFYKASTMAIKALRELDAQEKLKPMNEWISVKDRMPEIGECVLTLDKWGHIRDRELFRFKSGFICFRPDGLVPVKDITHWLPLPGEPEEEQ